MQDTLGDRMKAHEAVETGRRLDPRMPIYARIDGRGFSKFTKGMRKPFDERMSRAMVDAATMVMERTHARVAYTQSDEISLVWETPEEGDAFFGGKPHKLNSVLAGLATAAFTAALLRQEDEFARFADRLPHFDCRAFNLPSREEVAEAFLWRFLDARRNAVSMAARDRFPQSRLQGVSSRAALGMLSEDGVDFASLPEAFRLGTFLTRTEVTRALTAEDNLHLPERLRPPPGTLVVRERVQEVHLDLARHPDPAGFLLGASEGAIAA